MTENNNSPGGAIVESVPTVQTHATGVWKQTRVNWTFNETEM